MKQPIEVYVMVNNENYIIAVNSSLFLHDTEGWIKIDEGFGDRFAHAQTQYFDKPLADIEGNYLIKYEPEKNNPF